MGETVLVTGGMGFIGLHTARALLDAGCRVVVTRFRTWRLPAFLEGADGLEVEALDLRDGWRLLDVVRRHKVTGAVHLASPALGTGPGQDLPEAALSAVNVLEAARQEGVARVTVASSISVYTNVPDHPWREAAPLPVESDNPIAAAKKVVEVAALSFGDRTGLDVRVLRLAGIYGPLYHSMANLPSRLCHAAVRGLPPDLEGVRGGPPRAGDAADLCHVRDCAAGIASVHLGTGLRHRVYNVGGGRAVSNAELVAAVTRAVPSFALDLPLGGRGGGYMEITRIKADTGWRPAHDIEGGIADYVAWLRAEPAIGGADAGHRPRPMDSTRPGS